MTRPIAGPSNKMLTAIFYARFHPERGPSVIHQHPLGSVIPSAGQPGTSTLVHFSDIASCVIPPYELCNKALSVCSNGHRILGFPVSLEDQNYERNRFTFNICLVLDEKEDAHAWTLVVAKISAFFRAMEEEDGLLQQEERLPGLRWAGEEGYPPTSTGVVHPLLEAIVAGINAYRETCIRVDNTHVLNLRLDTTPTKPQKVHAWDVPLLIRSLPSASQWTRDLTLQRIYPHINGVTHIQRISRLADVETKLVRRAVRELIYHDRAMLLDVFHFQAVYALTRDFAWFVKDNNMLDECIGYITVDRSVASTTKPEGGSETITPHEMIIKLYVSLAPGTSVQDFVLAQQSHLINIDIRRFITFGVIKGFLRRIHRYAIIVNSSRANVHLEAKTDSSPSKSKPRSQEDAAKDFDRPWKRAALSSGWVTPPLDVPPSESLSRSARSAEELKDEEEQKLQSFLDRAHCLDGICVAMAMSEKKLVARLQSGRFGEVLITSR